MEPAGRRTSLWPLAVAVVALAAIITAGAVYVTRSVTGLPETLAEQGRGLVRDLASVAAAFRQGTVTTSFATYATEVSGTHRLQFATLRQAEVFTRTDSVSVLWGQLALPDVVVEARAPVEYTYYLDLDKPWSFRLQDGVVAVEAPAVEFNTPAIDASALRFDVREGSILRDETAALENLRLGLTELSKARARQHVGFVRETGRRQTERFVETWLAQGFADGRRFRAVVRFADEPPPPAPTRPPLG
jgi:hypothetical protein